MKSKIKGLELSGALDEQDDPARVARAFAYGLGISLVLWLLAAGLVVWLI